VKNYKINTDVKSRKILVVDDEIGNIKSITHNIIESKEPYVLYQALNGELAAKIAIAEMPDLIITDWEMPGINGIELIKRLKLNEVTAEIPVIMCTGVMTTSENLNTALMAGAVDYIRKPIDKIELLARVKSMLMLSDSRKVLKEKYLTIEQNHNFIQTLMESIPHPMVYYELTGEIKGYNQQFECLLGLDKQNIINNSIYNYFDISEKEIHQLQDHILLGGSDSINYEFEFEGNHYIFTKNLYATGSHPQGIICTLSNISELKKAHAEIIESKKKELASSALRLIQISEQNNNLISELENIKSLTSTEAKVMIQQCITKFSLNTGKGFWNEFESRFENVFESFSSTLNDLYPNLTPGEKRLCALLRLNLSTKDIATLTYQNPRSVDMTRYRLRKKLSLKTEENLVDFLLSIK